MALDLLYSGIDRLSRRDGRSATDRAGELIQLRPVSYMNASRGPMPQEVRICPSNNDKTRLSVTYETSKC